MPRKKKTETILDSSETISSKTHSGRIYPDTNNEVIEAEDVIEFTPDPELGINDLDFIPDGNLNEIPEDEKPEKELTEEEKRELKILKIKMSHWNYHPKKIFDDKYRVERNRKNKEAKKMRKNNNRKK